MNDIQARKYLDRINYSGSLEPCLDTLAALQKTHLMNVPFENLDIHYQTEIILDYDRIYRKIVENGRGGFCYELNGLFYQLLKHLGFDIHRISARVYAAGFRLPHEYDHLAIIATFGGVQYLADVGYKEFAFAPLKLEKAVNQKDERGNFMFDDYDAEHWRVSYISDTLMTPEYVFRNIHREYAEFAEMCHFQQYHEDSHFRKQKLITRPTDEGRITLTSSKLKITIGDGFEETPVETEEEFEKYLWEYFQIKI